MKRLLIILAWLASATAQAQDCRLPVTAAGTIHYIGQCHEGDWSHYSVAADSKGQPAARGINIHPPGWVCGNDGSTTLQLDGGAIVYCHGGPPAVGEWVWLEAGGGGTPGTPGPSGGGGSGGPVRCDSQRWVAPFWEGPGGLAVEPAGEFIRISVQRRFRRDPDVRGQFGQEESRWFPGKPDYEICSWDPAARCDDEDPTKILARAGKVVRNLGATTGLGHRELLVTVEGAKPGGFFWINRLGVAGGDRLVCEEHLVRGEDALPAMDLRLDRMGDGVELRQWFGRYGVLYEYRHTPDSIPQIRIVPYTLEER